MKNLILSIIVGFGAIWAIGAFISLEPSPIEWSEIGRAFYVLMSLFVSTMIFTFPGDTI